MNCVDILSENNINDLHNFLQKRKNDIFPFFAIRYPNENKVFYGFAENVIPGIHPGGFIVADFKNTDIFTILPNDVSILNGVLSHQIVYNNTQQAEPTPYVAPEKSTSQNQHREGVNKIISGLNEIGTSKCVLSRVIVKESSKSFLSIFVDLLSSRTDACVFVFRTQQTGTWVGASPELLLEADSSAIHSMALAGTRPRNSNEEWDYKNIEEQAIVTDFIKSSFLNNGLNPTESESYCKAAGNIEHICTDIFAIQNESTDIESLLKDLSPTPALCGFPKEYALKLIKETEGHDRGCYGGYFGIYNSPTDFRFYVNLRSIYIDRAKIVQFCGGGITRYSNAEDEWIETERKAQSFPV